MGSLPQDFEVSSVKDDEGMSKLQERLGKWRIQRRKCNSKMTDSGENKTSSFIESIFLRDCTRANSSVVITTLMIK
ncbi:uncharacterized protein G2W53_033310 [Senna tora]|uniref:Uncharacterized protein n=1 Tax=Senna tora TaxID=362788 RepID=A0A834SY87_9FABA|nr:uncharacterized protein G2W53_033310 [Senna tora]